MKKYALILLAGGKGKRFSATSPKQYKPLGNLPLSHHSLNVFRKFPEITQIIIICEPCFENSFSSFTKTFALPGTTRQASAFSGAKKVLPEIDYLIFHDAARPFPDHNNIAALLEASTHHPAATLAIPVSSTIKSVKEGFVEKTLDRSCLWEIQTPQIIKKDIYEKAMQHALEKNLEGTDDVSLVEALNIPVKIILGTKSNLKITTREDFDIAKGMIKK